MGRQVESIVRAGLFDSISETCFGARRWRDMLSFRIPQAKCRPWKPLERVNADAAIGRATDGATRAQEAIDRTANDRAGAEALYEQARDIVDILFNGILTNPEKARRGDVRGPAS